MPILLITSSVLVFAVWGYFLLQVYRKQKSGQGKIRGIIKFYNRGELGEDLNKIIQKWFWAFGALFVIMLLWVIFLTWQTDYNFFIAIYPFAWHYMFFRYFLWEKEDLLDHPAPK